MVNNRAADTSQTTNYKRSNSLDLSPRQNIKKRIFISTSPKRHQHILYEGRGSPAHLYSEYGTNYVRAARQLKGMRDVQKVR